MVLLGRPMRSRACRHKRCALASQTRICEKESPHLSQALDPSAVAPVLGSVLQPEHKMAAGRACIFALQLGQTICQRPMEHQSTIEAEACVPQHSQQISVPDAPSRRQALHNVRPSSALKPACIQRTPLRNLRQTPSDNRAKFANLVPDLILRSSLQDHHLGSVAHAREAFAVACMRKFWSVSVELPAVAAISCPPPFLSLIHI